MIPEIIFDRYELDKYLKDFNPTDSKSSDYYKAILQNLFFATLNSKMPKDGNERRFIDTSKKIRNKDYLLHLVYRYEECFKNSSKAIDLFRDIPFFNGGLFECLDYRDEQTKTEYRYDGFSTYPKKQPYIPNILFFGEEDNIDFRNEIDNKKQFKNIKVRGLINILQDYKFTIEENTPLEQEIALDPELLGRMFENLLASYNPETKTTARKQTGSFYTPREIVNYMVDESLKAYLLQVLEKQNSGTGYLTICSSQKDIFGNSERKGQLLIETTDDQENNSENGNQKKLEILFNSFIAENPFNEVESNTIIEGFSICKILDPACGSGAFPMGILHKMVELLRKLDPENLKWKEVQRNKAKQGAQDLFDIDNTTEREHLLEKINRVFDRNINHPDYARKLFLIENCIFGVDIQQIAVQISKLRFFISLIVEQKVDDSKPNRNILSMPNLETKFVAANTLIGLQSSGQIQTESNELVKLKADLKEVRHIYFSAGSRPEKLKYQKREKEIREKIGEIIKQDADNTRNSLLSKIEILQKDIQPYKNFKKEKLEKKQLSEHEKKQLNGLERSIKNKEKKIEKLKLLLSDDTSISGDAAKIASFDPYNQLYSNKWFDPEWMFGVSNGFDVVIGNPPYIGEKGNKHIFRELSISSIGKRFYQRKVDIFYFFFHIALDFLNSNGTFTFITTNYYPTADGAKNLRIDFKKRAKILKLINFNEIIIFESAKGQHNLITIGAKSDEKSKTTEIINCEGKEHICLSEVTKILNNESSKAKYQKLNHTELFDGDNAFIRFEKGGRIDVLNEMQNQSVKLNSYFNVNQGILSGADKVANRHIKLNLTSKSNKGKGVFVLTNNEVELMQFKDNEISLLKKFYKNSDVKRYIANNSHELNLLYLTRDLDLEDYPNIKTHIDKYKAIIKNRSTERGEMQAALKLGKWWVVFAARDKSIFEGEKIISPQRSHKNIFAYDNAEWFSSADVYYITKKISSPISLKYVLGLLNSSLYYQWLYNKGKRKGEMLELYATPLENIPIKIVATKIQAIFELIIDLIIYLSKEKKEHLCYQEIIDSMVFEIFFSDHMKELEIDVLQFVEQDIAEVMQCRDFEKLTDAEKEQVIEQLHQKWSNPDSEVKKRIDSFAEKSPDILKPILESK